MTIRILQVVGRMDRGGIETLLMNIYRNIDKSAVQFDFLCHYGVEADFNEEIRSMGGIIYEMPKIKSTTKTYYHNFFKYIKALDQFFYEHKEFDVVHGHMTNTAILYLYFARKHGVKYRIAHSHLTQSTKSINGIITSLLHKPIEKIANIYFSCSEKASNWLYKKKTIEKGNVKIINNAVDADKYNFNSMNRQLYREKLGLENKMVVGHVGRFFHQKNHSFLVDIFHDIHKANPNAVLMLVGAGNLEEEIKQKVDMLGLNESVLFMGLRSDVHHLMQAMDCFLMPSFFEGLPVVGIEAQAAGLPCIVSSEISTDLDIIGNVEFMSLEESSQTWAEAVVKTIDSFDRVSTKTKIVESGYDIAEVSSWIENFYLNLSSNAIKGEKKWK